MISLEVKLTRMFVAHKVTKCLNSHLLVCGNNCFLFSKMGKKLDKECSYIFSETPLNGDEEQNFGIKVTLCCFRTKA